VNVAVDVAFRRPAPEPATALDFVYSPTVDPCSAAFEAPAKLEGQPTTMVDLSTPACATRWRRDERIVLFGEDVATHRARGARAGQG